MFDDKELDSSGIQLPQETLKFLRSIDRPGTILMLFDLYAYGFAGVTGRQMALLARFLARETRHMTIRGGGHHFHLMELVLKYRSADEPTDRFEFFLTQHQSSFVEGLEKANVHVFREGEIPEDSPIAHAAMELDFQRDEKGHTFAEWVFQDNVGEEGKKKASKLDLLYNSEHGWWTVGDMVAVLGWQDISPATNILHMGGVFGPYEGALIRRAGYPAFNALEIEYPVNVAYRDPDTEAGDNTLASNRMTNGDPAVPDYDERGVWFEFNETVPNLSLCIDPYAHASLDNEEEPCDSDEANGIPWEVKKNEITCGAFVDEFEGDWGSCVDGTILAADVKELSRKLEQLKERKIDSFGPIPEREPGGCQSPFDIAARREVDGAWVRLSFRILYSTVRRDACEIFMTEKRLGELCDYFRRIHAWFPPLGLGETRASRWAQYKELE